MMIKAVSKQPGKPPRSVHVSNELESLQKYVGGYIECVTVAHDTVMIVNEEGHLLGLPFNFSMDGTPIVGPALFVGCDGEEFTDIKIPFDVFKLIFSMEENENV